MKVLVIPDVHLKPWMFQRASDLMKEIKADRAVCLMDIADDWRQQFNLDLYIQTYDMAIDFAKKYPETLWCYGNHDVCYLWNQRETGYSKIAPWTVCEKLRILQESLPDERQLAYLHRIDKVLFSHGGLADDFVRRYVPASKYNDIDAVIETINGFACGEMWQDESPIWYRPQYYEGRLYKPRKLLQVVGHTPVEGITRKGNLISCDVFSTDSSGKPIERRSSRSSIQTLGSISVFADEGRNIQMAVRNLDDSNRVFAVEVDMENRTPEEIAKDAALQIGALFDRLIKEQPEKDDQNIV